MATGRENDAIPVGRVIDRFDMEIVEFVLCWAPYGGPPEDECMPRFGMTVDRLWTRFRDIVETGHRRHLSTTERALVERAAASNDLRVDAPVTGTGIRPARS